ncbi:DMT family transporter [Rhizobium sp. C4]|uniref:DMT family transporter n=1 Tax=Rhizobium sp. C4 TaxID=1349800 RepID=UPI001E2E4754|nr:multidrug efflux SMR transporter [Rhizobium sp. C4]MCD2172743.1 multidrug efflux SMR transporter [Rhizobium sp. C4]
MSWIFLLVAGGLEVVWAYSMKLSHGFTRPVPSIVTIVAMLGSVGLLALAMRELPLGTSYMIWTGIGALGAFLVGVIFLGDALTPMRAIAATCILVGLVTMKMAS